MASKFSDEDVRQDPRISSHQRAAASDPDRRTRDLLGNFADFESLFDQLSEPALVELGKPLPKAKYMPRRRIGRCPAAHNQALLDREES